MKILITGGCGFIGSGFIRYIEQLDHDFEITVLDNLILGNKKSIENFKVNFLEGDIRDPETVAKAVQNQDAIIHLAADTRVLDSIENPQFNFDVNVIGTFQLLMEAKKNNIKKFIFASTGGAIIGDIEPPVHEQIPPKPISPYGASKLFAEGYLSAFHGSYDISCISLRFSNVYGPGSIHKGSAVANIFKSILRNEDFVVYGDGTQTRDYVYIDDISHAIILALKSDFSGIFQLGSGDETSLNQLMDIVNNEIKDEHMLSVKYTNFRKGEVLRNYADISNAVQNLLYCPTTSLEEGIHKTWTWFKSEI